MRWPGVIEAGGIIEAPTHICDWAPTLIRLAGGEEDEAWKLDGRDIGALLFGDENSGTAASSATRTLYWRDKRGTAIRSGDWKLIVSNDGRRTELFDLAADPYEKEDLSGKHPDIIAGLRAEIESLQSDDFPL